VDNRKICSKNCDETCTDPSHPPSKSITPIYSNERRISETDNVPTASTICVLFSSLHMNIKYSIGDISLS
jgi:hypothetical protein